MANDHYIPQFYLKSFEVPGRTGWIYSYKRGNQPRAVAIRSVASAPDFYTLKTPQTKVPQNDPDRILQKIESDSAPILKSLLTANKLELSENERMILATFVGLLATRTPMARERALNVHLAMRMRLLKDLAENKQKFYELVPKLKLDMTSQELEVARKGLLDPENNLKVSFKGDVDDFSLQKSFNTGTFLSTILVNKKWVLVESRKGQRFITSDNPFITLVPTPYVPGMDVNPANAECLFPLSSRRALLFSNRIVRNSIYRVGRDRLTSWIQQIISFGFESIFASFASEYVQNEFDQIPAGEITKIPISSIPPVLPMMEL